MVIDKLDKYANIFMQMLIERYDAMGLRASGKFAESLRSEITNKSMIVFGEDYAMQMERGRAPGKMPPVNEIEKWIDEKRGITAPSDQRKKRQMAWAIATKIKQVGINVPNKYNVGGVISDTISEFVQKHVPRLVDEIFKEKRLDINSEIIENLTWQT